jgi:hypothetical protein
MARAVGRYVARHHVALLALFVALGGTAVAASNALLPKNSVGSAQVINGSLQKADLSRKAARALKGQQGIRGARGATGQAGPIGPAGAPGAAGASATKLFAHVEDDGTLSSVAQGATSAVRNSKGSYTVGFDRSLQGCVALAQVGFVQGVTGSFSSDTLAQTIVHTNDVLVQLFDPGVAPIDGNFNLIVFC